MAIRDERQVEFANVWLDGDRKNILLLAPRFGKCRVGVYILHDYPLEVSILIAYPDKKIKASWENEFSIMNFTPNVTFVTHLSLYKYQDTKFDLVILDEIHLLSPAQIEVCKTIVENNPILGFTGTLSQETEKSLYNKLRLPVLAEYTIEQAVEEKIVSDYEITVVQVPLDTYHKQRIKTRFITEKQQFNSLTWAISALEEKKKSSMFMRLKRMRIIQNSLSKLNKTKRILMDHPNDRMLVFCGTTAIADSLDIPSYHSKSSEKEIFNDFAEGRGTHLAVVKIGNTGVTYVPLDRVIINYFSSSPEDLTQKVMRCMSFEFGNPDKKAYITIISSNEDVEIKWLQQSLSQLDSTKIKYI